MRRMNGLMTLSTLSGALLLSSAPVAADEVGDFYKGNTGTIISGYGSGSTYTLYARAVSNHIGRHLPGNPTFVVKSMTGGGSLRAASFLFKAAPQDGSHLGALGRGVATEPIVFGPRSRTKFDPRKFHWLGSLNSEVSIGGVWHTSGIKSLADARKKSVFVATGGQAADSATFTRLCNAIFGTRFKLVAGYRGGGAQNIAMERGEVQGRIGWSWSSVAATKMDWVKDGKINLLVQFALEKHPDLPDVPLALDLTDDPDEKRILEVAFIRQGMGRPYVAPPGTPKARVDALRAAFEKLLTDPAFLAETKKLHLEVNAPKTGAQVEAMVKKAFDLPQSLKDRVADATAPRNAELRMIEKKKK